MTSATRLPLALLVCICLASGCDDESGPASTLLSPVPSATATAENTATSTVRATATATPNPFPHGTPPRPTPTRTPTRTQEATATETATQTATPSQAPTAPPVDSNLAVAPAGGCHPTGLVLDTPLDMLSLVDPEWAPVINGPMVDSDPILIHGTVTGSHGDTGGDFPSTHVRSDQNTFVELDAADSGRLGTGNGNELALEWEAGAYPDWAWGSAGDRVAALGRWIFDCGHPAPHGGHCSATMTQGCALDSDCLTTHCPDCQPGETCGGNSFGYSTEMHPPYATAVIRSGRGAIASDDAGAAAVPATRVDVFASGYAGGAGDRCVLTNAADPLDLLSTECFPLTNPVAASTLNSRDFTFDVPLPPQPPGGAATWRIVERAAPGGTPAALQVTAHDQDSPPHLTVTLRLTQGTPLPTGYAGTLYAGWRPDSTALAHVRLTVDAVVIRNPLQRSTPVIPRLCSGNQMPCATTADCPSHQTCNGVGSVKSWRLQAALNGEWQELHGLESVNAGDVIAQGLVFEQDLPLDGQLRLIANGDGEDCIHTMLGKSLATDLAELGLNDGGNCLLSTPHDPGAVDVAHVAPDFGAGTHEVVSNGGEGGTCSATTARLCLFNSDCPTGETCTITGGAFALRYHIEHPAN